MMKALAMANTVLICFMLLIFASFNPSCGYTLKLIHMDSRDSPYHIANDTLELRHKRWTELSERRYQHHFQELGVVLEGGPNAEARLQDEPIGLMLAEFFVGTPFSRQLAVMDTGSSFLWVVAEKSPYMLGDYSCANSSICTTMLCWQDECENVPQNNYDCIIDENCSFSIHYIGLVVAGVVATDTITFAVAEGTVDFSGITFGLGKVTSEHELGSEFQGTGVMGLSNWPSSIAGQVGSRFSYCIGNLSDPEYGYNRLTFGEALELPGMWTPLLYFSCKVYVSLQKIIVQGEELDIDPTLFEGSLSGGGTLIDSGSPYSYLTDEAYKVFLFLLVLNPLLVSCETHPDRLAMDNAWDAFKWHQLFCADIDDYVLKWKFAQRDGLRALSSIFQRFSVESFIWADDNESIHDKNRTTPDYFVPSCSLSITMYVRPIENEEELIENDPNLIDDLRSGRQEVKRLRKKIVGFDGTGNVTVSGWSFYGDSKFNIHGANGFGSLEFPEEDASMKSKIEFMIVVRITGVDGIDLAILKNFFGPADYVIT